MRNRRSVEGAEIIIGRVVVSYVVAYCGTEELTAYQSVAAEEQSCIGPVDVELIHTGKVDLIVHVAVDCVASVIEVIKSRIDGDAK